MERLDGKGHTSPQKQKILLDLYKVYARTDHIGKSRTCDFARDLVQWHVKKKHLRDDVNVEKEVHRIIEFFDVSRDGRISRGALLTQASAHVLLKYNFKLTYNRRRTQHVLQASMHGILGRKEVEIILSYTQEWQRHKGPYIGYGVKNGYWRNGWGWDTFKTGIPHKSHASSHGRKGDGLSHWSCCGNVDKCDSFCYAIPPPPLSPVAAAAAVVSSSSSQAVMVAEPLSSAGDNHHHDHHHQHHLHQGKAIAVAAEAASVSSSSRANSQGFPPENKARLSPISLPHVARKVTPSSRTDGALPEPLQLQEAQKQHQHHEGASY